MNRFGVAIAGMLLAVASGSAVAQQRGDWSRDRSNGDAQDEVRETQGNEDAKQPAQQDDNDNDNGDGRRDGERSAQRDGSGQRRGGNDRNGGGDVQANRSGDLQANRSGGNQDWRDGDRDGNRGDWNGNGNGNGSRDGRSSDRYGQNGGYRNDDRNGNRNRGHRDGRYAYYSHGKGYGYNRWRAPSHYVRPHGWYSYRWGVGHRLPPAWYGPAYYVDYGVYGLAPPPYGYRWVRVNNDVLLVAIATGIVADVLTNFYYY